MKNHITFILLLLPFLMLSQVFQDNFNDGNFTTNPEWFGDTSAFIINANQELQLNDTTGGTAQLYAPLTIADSTVWEFYFRMEFAPSTSNQLRIYLSTDATDLSGSLNGYYLEIGASSATDALKLYKQTGTIHPVSGAEWERTLASCEGALMGAGFEGPAEALFLKKKLLVIPMAFQYEQQCNAASLEEIGVHVVWRINASFESEIRHWLHHDKTIPVHYPDETAKIIQSIFDTI